MLVLHEAAYRGAEDDRLRVFICNECVGLCTDIIATSLAGESGPGVEAWEQQLSDDELLAHLPKVAALSAQVERQLSGLGLDKPATGA